MTRLIGYARTSTEDQLAGLEAQERDLRALGCAHIFSEHVSALADERPQLTAALLELRQGDTLVITKPDRLARSVRNLLGIVEDLKKRGIGIRIVSMGLDTGGPEGKLMLTMLGAVAEFERDIMLVRQREGIAKARTAGKYKGRKPRDASEIRRLAAAGVNQVRIAAQLGLSRSTVHRAMVRERCGD
jgi:DNA invertase Pin-like site-specific DNA recombinase